MRIQVCYLAQFQQSTHIKNMLHYFDIKFVCVYVFYLVYIILYNFFSDTKMSDKNIEKKRPEDLERAYKILEERRLKNKLNTQLRYWNARGYDHIPTKEERNQRNLQKTPTPYGNGLDIVVYTNTAKKLTIEEKVSMLDKYIEHALTKGRVTIRGDRYAKQRYQKSRKLPPPSSAPVQRKYIKRKKAPTANGEQQKTTDTYVDHN
jgi:hypothetical protein